MTPTVARRRWYLLCALLALLCAAPTPGDIGSCGQAVEDLDARSFFEAKRGVDCDACRSCGFETERCRVACGEPLDDPAFPEGCFPLVIDGQVCLRALRHTACDDYEPFVSDVAASVPTECDFCPPEQRR